MLKTLQTKLKSLYSPPCSIPLLNFLKAITTMVDEYVHLHMYQCVYVCAHLYITTFVLLCVSVYKIHNTEGICVGAKCTVFGARWPRFKSQIWLKKKKNYLAVLGLSRAQDLQSSSWHVESLVTASKHLVVACGIYFPDQGLNLAPLLWECGVLAKTTRKVPRSDSY